MSAEIWGTLGAAVLAALVWLVRLVRRHDRTERDLRDAQDYQRTMERMTDADLPDNADAARQRMRDRPANQR